MKKLEKDLNDASIMERIQADTAEAQTMGFNGTPAFVVNGVSMRGAFPFNEFKVVIDRHLSAKK
jgi:protein-disulfide isomerase